MKNIISRTWILVVVVATAMAIFVSVAAQLAIRNIWVFLDSEPQFQQIFAQIRHGSYYTPAWLILLLAGGFAYPVCKYCRKWYAIALAVLGGILVCALLTAIAMLTTKVNGILFGDVLFSLLDVLSKGGLG